MLPRDRIRNVAFDLAGIAGWKAEARRKEESKTLRKHAQNRDGAAVHDDTPANHIRVSMKFAFKQLIGENDSFAILGPEETAECRTSAGYVPEIGGYTGEYVPPGPVGGGGGMAVRSV